MPPASTRAPFVKVTPAAFWMITVPGARIAPAMTLGLVDCTRFRVAEPRPVWSKTTSWSRPTSKRFQSTIARREAWRITVRSAVCEIAALPRATVPPVGPWAAAGAARARSEPPTSKRPRAERRERPAVITSVFLNFSANCVRFLLRRRL